MTRIKTTDAAKSVTGVGALRALDAAGIKVWEPGAKAGDTFGVWMSPHDAHTPAFAVQVGTITVV